METDRKLVDQLINWLIDWLIDWLKEVERKELKQQEKEFKDYNADTIGENKENSNKVNRRINGGIYLRIFYKRFFLMRILPETGFPELWSNQTRRGRGIVYIIPIIVHLKRQKLNETSVFSGKVNNRKCWKGWSPARHLQPNQPEPNSPGPVRPASLAGAGPAIYCYTCIESFFFKMA